MGATTGPGNYSKEVRVPFANVEEAIARKGDGDGISFYDNLVAARPAASATDLAKFVLGSLGVEESTQKSGGVRTRYGNDVQSIAARVRNARQRAAANVSGPQAATPNPQSWAAEVEATAIKNPAYMAALIQVLRESGHLDS